jgi:hypothetical protein
MTYANKNGSFVNESGAPPIKTYVPLTGTTVKLSIQDQYVAIVPAGTIAALTVQLPLVNGNGDWVEIWFGAVITALTIKDGAGTTITPTLAPTAGAIGKSIRLTRIGGAWVNWRS